MLVSSANVSEGVPRKARGYSNLVSQQAYRPNKAADSVRVFAGAHRARSAGATRTQPPRRRQLTTSEARPEEPHLANGDSQASAPVLTRRIAACSSVGKLQGLYAQYAACLDFIHLSAILTRTAKLSAWQLDEQGGQEAASKHNRPARADGKASTDDGRIELFLSEVAAQLQTHQQVLRGREAANTLWALSKFGSWQLYRQHAGWLLGVVELHVGSLKAQEVSSVLYALATAPAPSLGADGNGIACISISSSGTSAAGTGNGSSGSSQAGADVALLRRLSDQLLLPDARPSPQALVTALWALQRLQVQAAIEVEAGGSLHSTSTPGQGTTSTTTSTTSTTTGITLLVAPEWLQERYLPACVPLMYNFTPHGLSLLVWTLARLRQCPSRSWTSKYMDAAYRLLPSFNPQALTTMLYGLVELQVQPPLAWTQHVLERISEVTHSLNAQDVANTMTVLGKLSVRVRPSVVLVDALLVRAYELMPDMQPEGLAALISGLAVLQCRPSKPWAERFLDAARAHAGGMDAKTGAQLLWGLTQLDYKPNARWLAPLYASLAGKVAGFNAHDVRQLLQAVSMLKARPAWLPELLAKAQALLDEDQAAGQAHLQALASGTGTGHSGINRRTVGSTMGQLQDASLLAASELEALRTLVTQLSVQDWR